MNKDSIRQKALEIRKSIPKELRREKSEKICLQISDMIEYKQAKTVMLYSSYRSEVETDLIIKNAFSDGKRVLLPYCVPGTCMMLACEIKENETLFEGSYGIYEPKPENEVCASEIDIVIVPGVAFDKSGNRMGYGKGYYDRFLEKVRSDCYVVGLTFEETLLDSLPVCDHDFVMKRIVFA